MVVSTASGHVITAVVPSGMQANTWKGSEASASLASSCRVFKGGVLAPDSAGLSPAA